MVNQRRFYNFYFNIGRLGGRISFWGGWSAFAKKENLNKHQRNNDEGNYDIGFKVFQRVKKLRKGMHENRKFVGTKKIIQRALSKNNLQQSVDNSFYFCGEF